MSWGLGLISLKPQLQSSFLSLNMYRNEIEAILERDILLGRSTKWIIVSWELYIYSYSGELPIKELGSGIVDETSGLCCRDALYLHEQLVKVW